MVKNPLQVLLYVGLMGLIAHLGCSPETVPQGPYMPTRDASLSDDKGIVSMDRRASSTRCPLWMRAFPWMKMALFRCRRPANHWRGP